MAQWHNDRNITVHIEIHAKILLYSFPYCSNLKSVSNTLSYTMKKINQQGLVCQNPQNLLQKNLPQAEFVRGRRALREFKTDRRAFEEQTLNLMSREAAATGVQLLTKDEGWVEVENLRGAVREPVTKCIQRWGYSTRHLSSLYYMCENVPN